MGDHLFADWRYNADGSPKPDFVLNKPESKGCKILLAGDNFRVRFVPASTALGA